jgi:branched-chain amino acid aminotransferase
MGIFFNYNGQLFQDQDPVFSPENRSFKFGDGLFETIKLEQGILKFKAHHFERLFEGSRVLGFTLNDLITPAYFEGQVLDLVKINGHEKAARVRLSVFRKDSDITDPEVSSPDFVIQSRALKIQSNIQDYSVGLLPGIFKSCDELANLKTNNFLPYIMATMHAKKTGYNECIIFNSHGRICDASRGNVFIITDNNIYTPPLSEGCIAGVMRRNLLVMLNDKGYAIDEKPLQVEDIHSAEEMFITNVISGIQPVVKFQDKFFTTSQSLKLKRLSQSTF